VIKRYLAFADIVARAFLWVTMALLVLLIGATLYEVVARYGFSAPTMWAFDVTYMINGALLLLAAAFTLLVNEHVRIDVFAVRLPLRFRLAVEIAFYIFLFLPGIALIAYAAFRQTWHAFITDDRVLESAWEPLIWPFYASISLGILGLWVQALADAIRHIIRFRAPEGSPPEGGTEGR
jgi:TRAP-type mannitol/chloroaromatic compound transport system permease small subunit